MRVVIINDDCHKYVKEHGFHFTEKLCKFAISNMETNISGQTMSKEEADKLLSTYNITLRNNKEWDYVYVANMALHDLYTSSIKTEAQLALFIKDIIDDANGYEGMPFCRWKADLCHNNTLINWAEYV